MSALQFLCPSCDALLRMRPEQLAATPQFHCPSCQRLLNASATSNGVLATPVATTEFAQPADAGIAGQTKAVAGHSTTGTLASPTDKAATETVASRHESSASRLDRIVQRANSAPAKPASKVKGARPAAIATGVTPWYLSPLLIAWVSAIAFASVLIGYVVWQNAAKSNRVTSDTPDKETASADNSGGPNAATPKAGEKGTVKPAGTVQDRLNSLGITVRQQLTVTGSFPAGTWPAPEVPVDRRFSWLAKLVESQSWQPSVPVDWSRPWNDPSNETFVRRRVSELQNPSVTQLTRSDGHPATHFVGMAGVGTDAASLPTSDPRAGIFGHHRLTRAKDVVDGLGNTIMMAGVQEQLGSWAAGGSATVRGITREPYVNGPDGFGTGHALGMQVLMADGSVRELSKDTDAQTIRQLATIADDRRPPEPKSSDPAVPAVAPANPDPKTKVAVANPIGDLNPLPAAPPINAVAPEQGGKQPGQKPPVKAANPPDKAAPARNPRIIAEPVVPPAAPGKVANPRLPVRKVDAETALKVRMIQYRRDEAQPLRVILDELAEMSGVDIVCEPSMLGEAGMSRLDTKMILNLRVVTIRDVLQAALQKAELDFRLEDGQVHITLPARKP